MDYIRAKRGYNYIIFLVFGHHANYIFFLDKTFFISDILDDKNCLLGRHVGKKRRCGQGYFFIICKKLFREKLERN